MRSRVRTSPPRRRVRIALAGAVLALWFAAVLIALGEHAPGRGAAQARTAAFDAHAVTMSLRQPAPSINPRVPSLPLCAEAGHPRALAGVARDEAQRVLRAFPIVLSSMPCFSSRSVPRLSSSEPPPV